MGQRRFGAKTPFDALGGLAFHDDEDGRSFRGGAGVAGQWFAARTMANFIKYKASLTHAGASGVERWCVISGAFPFLMLRFAMPLVSARFVGHREYHVRSRAKLTLGCD